MTFILFLIFLVIALVPALLLLRRELKAQHDAQADDSADAKKYSFDFKKLIFPVVWFAFTITALMVLGYFMRTWVNYLWFAEVGATGRFFTEFYASWALYAGSLVVFGLLFYLNLQMTRVNYKDLKGKMAAKDGRVFIQIPALFISAVFMLVLSADISNNWASFLSWWYQTSFGSTDPIFGKDISFYVFSLPFWLGIFKIILTAALMSVFPAAMVYLLNIVDIKGVLNKSSSYRDVDEVAKDKADYEKAKHILTDHVISHMAFIGGIVMFCLIALVYLDRYAILASDQGVVFGAGYTDVNFDLPMHWVLIASLVVSAGFMLSAISAKELKQTIKRAIIGVAIPVLVFGLGSIALSYVYQWAFVEKNEMELESPYLAHDLAYTKAAFKLDVMTKKDFPAASQMDAGGSVKDQSTLSNIRLWTPKTLQDVNQNRQAFKTYYDFYDIDIDRYKIGSKKEEVMLSARELNSDQLPTKTWQNTHMQYTHGYGVVMAPVNGSTTEGSPNYLIRDIASKSDVPSLQITQPRIYFGELTKSHVYVGTDLSEFDYPEGEDNTSFNYDGPAGIKIGNFFRKASIALSYDGITLMLAKGINPESRILIHRSISDRLNTVSPFITYDSDVYQVISDGQLYFMVDGYTTSSYYPYSKPASDGSNYIRNSVKAVVNAYTGKIDLYIADDTDPIIQTYEKIYPGLFQSIGYMPQSLKEHLRYPEHMLKMQAETLASYHMVNPRTFYQKEDKWQISSTGSLETKEKTVQMEPYYVNMRLPDSASLDSEFMLVLPFSPVSNMVNKAEGNTPQRINLVGWLVGRCDPEHYGELNLYMFPKDKETEGPLMIWNRIMQDEFISKDISLWNKEGSKVVPGNLMVVPLSNNQLIYVQSIFIQSASSPTPELKKVVVATSDRMVYKNSLPEALAEFFGTARQAKPCDTSNPNGVSAPTDTEISAKVKEASLLFEQYQKANASGDYKKAGEILSQIQGMLTSATK